MKLTTSGGTLINIKASLLLLIGGICLTGEWISLFIYSAALMLHEEAHFIFARTLGYRVTTLELQPFGFSARLDRRAFAWDELCICSAGPLCSILAGVICVAIGTLNGSQNELNSFADANFSIGFINLLPAAPLDGGRALRGFLDTGSFDSQRLISILSVSISLLLTSFGVLLLITVNNPTALIMGLFLFSSAIRELSGHSANSIHKHLNSRSRIVTGEAVPVKHFCISGDTTIGEACRLIIKNSYSILYILDHNMKVCAKVDEERLIVGSSALGSDSTLFALVDRLNESC